MKQKIELRAVSESSGKGSRFQKMKLDNASPSPEPDSDFVDPDEETGRSGCDSMMLRTVNEERKYGGRGVGLREFLFGGNFDGDCTKY